MSHAPKIPVPMCECVPPRPAGILRNVDGQVGKRAFVCGRLLGRPSLARHSCGFHQAIVAESWEERKARLWRERLAAAREWVKTIPPEQRTKERRAQAAFLSEYQGKGLIARAEETRARVEALDETLQEESK